jgi:hypothetical protein
MVINIIREIILEAMDDPEIQAFVADFEKAVKEAEKK